jgi:hypothetical protein
MRELPASVRFVPLDVMGTDPVREITIFPDRMELITAAGTARVLFRSIARPQSPYIKYYLRRILKGGTESLAIGERWGNRFRFYTKPPITITVPRSAGEIPNVNLDIAAHLVMMRGGYILFDMT